MAYILKKVLVLSKNQACRMPLTLKGQNNSFNNTVAMGLILVEVTWFLSCIWIILSSVFLFHDKVVHRPAGG